MNSRERVTKAINLEEPDHVPVGPFMIWHQPVVAGVKMYDYCWDVDTCFEANRKAFEYYDRGFDVMNLAPMLLAYSNINPVLYSALYFNWEFFENSIPQFREVPQGDETLCGSTGALDKDRTAIALAARCGVVYFPCKKRTDRL